MIKELEKIITILRRFKRPVVDYLNKGLNKEYIDELCQQNRIQIPDDLKELYQQINGTKIIEGTILDDLHFFPGFYMLSFEDGIKSYNNFISDQRWNKMWFPIFANGGGDFYCIHMETHNIIGFILGETDHLIEYLNLNTMFNTIAECFKQKAYYVDLDNSLEININKEIKISSKHNPGLERWAE